mmetsp:Transcript_11336/g.22945  ORF Transcript_11336/g.22945 Transcript_11336/m.22945 type:complete len:168 (-) Transcript_11336:4614-5117(-)
MSLRPDLATCWYRLCGVVHRHGMGRILLATAGYDHTIRLWEAATAASSRTLQFADSHANCLEFSPDGRHLAVGGNPNVVLFDVPSANLNPFYLSDAHCGNAVSAKFERDGNWVCSGSDDGSLRTWDPPAAGTPAQVREQGTYFSSMSVWSCLFIGTSSVTCPVYQSG